MAGSRNHGRAVLTAVFVTLLWSSSWVFIKTGLNDIPALQFAGLRYFIAFLILLPFAARANRAGAAGGLSAALSRRHIPKLLALGLVMYTLTQGAQFVALSYLPAQTTSLVLSFSPVLVAFMGIVLLGERPVSSQWLGVFVYLVGAAIFLYPAELPAGQLVGLAVALLGLVSNAGAAVLGRAVNRGRQLDALTVTVVSMGIGSVVLVAAGLIFEGWPQFGARAWLIILGLALVNTALAFTLWNASQRVLSAMESSVINNTMLIQIALLAWLFLGEELGAKQLIGLGLAAAGTLAVQLSRRPPARA